MGKKFTFKLYHSGKHDPLNITCCVFAPHSTEYRSKGFFGIGVVKAQETEVHYNYITAI